ncbi:dCMP deaminase family protein [Paraglaciecola sp. L1A13]|uniref:deoxycytidylate deaminase n=1 Tax=Paraglaciecola sp. L1A13 TaxID=2686359 RepID=UPI00131C99B0|nr:dCMP deaminase family protein [Paraglaciecola sp. L1A13]
MSLIHSKLTSWDQRYFELAQVVGSWSKDRSTKIGCVIVGPHNEIRSTGFNGFPRDADDDLDERHSRPAKYKWTEHAERNAIYNAARAGISLDGCRMYLPWFPCMDCARAIVQSGISELIAFSPNLEDQKWGEDFRFALDLFEECSVNVRFVEIEV